MLVQIGGKPESTLDDPIGLLKDCHRRIEGFLNIQHQAVRKAHGRALTAEERQMVEASLRYFRESEPRHNADEEESLFPRLRGGEAAAILADMARLEGEHRQNAPLHKRVAELYSRWIAEGPLTDDEAGELRTITEQFQKTYQAHIRLEEEVVFPHAAKNLKKDELLAIGGELKARRS
jgi:hemerythrin-like domain-containing protein